MAFSSNDDDNVLSEINITPLVDVMLVLLVTFIITIPALTNAIHVNLPKTVSTAPPESQTAVNVTVAANGKIFVDDAEIAGDYLEKHLRDLKAKHEDLALHLRADEHGAYGPVAKVMAAIEHAGISRVSVLTEGQ